MKKKILISILILSLTYLNSFGQWLDEQTIQSTVLIEKITDEGFITHGTGFLMYNYDSQSDFVVVTCAHLISNKKMLSIRFNPDSSLLKHLSVKEKRGTFVKNVIITESSIRLLVQLDDNNRYIHPELDIAAFHFSFPQLVKKTDTGMINLKAIDFKLIPHSQIKKKSELSLGDEVYFIGFPLGYGVTKFVEPIVRSGSIAWLPTEYDFFLLDAFSYGGNSGSPVFQKVIVGSKPGDLKWSSPKLVGMVVGHQSIELKNILNQPNPDELKFEVTDVDLNIGLARCVYVDDILFTVDELNKKLK
jgi:hypothetical protein